MKLTTLEETIENLNVYNARTNNYERGWKLLRKYQERLKEEVKLWMFVPCTSLGEKLEKPKYNSDHDEVLFEANFKRYEEGQARVLFKDINLINNHPTKKDIQYIYINDVQIATLGDTIYFEPKPFGKVLFEDILYLCDNEIELTESGQKYFEV